MKTLRTLTTACAATASLGVAQSASAYGLDGFPHGAVFQIEHTAANAADLTDFQVRLQLDSAAEIAAGRMRADCADLRVYADEGCAPEAQTSFWVADGTCNTSKTDVWVIVPTLHQGATQKVAMFWGNAAAASMSNGSAVFPIFFDDFNGDAVDATKWDLFAPQRNEQSGGMLRGGGGAAAIWSKAKVVEAGATVFGVRTDAQAQSNADIEYGASTIHQTSGHDEIHWSSRTYSGVTWMSYDFAAAFIGGQRPVNAIWRSASVRSGPTTSATRRSSRPSSSTSSLAVARAPSASTTSSARSDPSRSAAAPAPLLRPRARTSNSTIPAPRRTRSRRSITRTCASTPTRIRW